MIHLAGADIVLPDGIVPGGTLVVRDGRIAEVRARSTLTGAAAGPLAGHLIVPGFIDAHVHGVGGVDTLDRGDAVARIASLLPQFGVTAFCPTTVACTPAHLHDVLVQVRAVRECPDPLAARVLPAHLESNFLNPDWRGAQPAACVRACGPIPDPLPHGSSTRTLEFEAADILWEIARAAPDIALVTLAPEIDGGLDLVRWLVARGIRVSLGHSGASYVQAIAAFDAGARHATHLFNRMPPLNHREPGLVGASLQRDDVTVELICDGTHVHAAAVQLTVAAKTPSRVLAITDGTAVSGLPDGARATLGGQAIEVARRAAWLADGTLAGSALTMDGVFRMLTGPMGFSPVDAATMCATTPARALGLVGHGVIVEGAAADLAVLDAAGRVVQTYVGGRLVHAQDAAGLNGTSSSSV
jgi:N-acetylglucosamine-6-phosphate deacetylase